MLFRKRILSAIAVMFLLSSCAGRDSDPLLGDGYTAVNIWWYKPFRIYSTNYHRGKILPAGTRVTITDISSKQIYFTRKSDGKEFAILRMKRHTRLHIGEHAKRLFSKTDPKGPGSRYEKFTKKEKYAIKAGGISKGIGKDAALMAYGYPPDHRTPDLNSDSWIYFKGLYHSVRLNFNNGKADRSIY